MSLAWTISLMLMLTVSYAAAQIEALEKPAQNSAVGLDQILANLEQRNAQRAAALQQFEGKRIYKMQYRGFPGDKDAEMVVKVSFHAPDSKEFTVLSQSGSKFVIDHVFQKLIQSEEEAVKDENRKAMTLTRQNYDFELAGFESAPNGGQYVLKIVPKTKNKFMYRGTIWVDAKDFAVTRIEGEPGKNPSMWIKKTDIAHRYMKVNDFWLPAENRTESFIRMGGKATLSIEYQDYKIIKSTPLKVTRNTRPGGDAIFDNMADDAGIWANRVARRTAH